MIRVRLTRLLQRLRPIALNTGLVLFSTFVALVAAELAIRVVSPQQLILIRPDLWQPADTIGWEHRPNVSTRINTGERTVDVFTDAEGFRVGADGPVEADRAVLLLGDSFVEALQVDYEESAAGLLEASLATVPGGPVAVRNAGIGGWDPGQYALRAKSLFQKHDYDVVVTAIYLGNDIVPEHRTYVPPRAPVQRTRLRLPRNLSGEELTWAILRPLNDFLEVRSHLFIFLKNRLQTLRMAIGLAAVSFPPQFHSGRETADWWRITADIFEEIHDSATQEGTKAIFLLLPAPFQVDEEEMTRYVEGFDLDPDAIDLGLPNRKLGDELSARGLAVFDVLPAFRSAHAEGVHLYGDVDQHLTPEGNEILAEVMLPLVTERLAARAVEDPS